jgi:lysophospholipase L1-like esterase
MITILCFGDSNTWGSVPGTGERFPPDIRWPGVLQRRLGAAYRVIEEGLSGRTTVFDDPLGDGKNGRTYLTPCLESHKPLDVVIIMLGTNDVQTRFHASAVEIAWGAELLVRTAQKWAPAVVLVAPAPLSPIPEVELGGYQGAAEKMLQLPRFYKEVAERNGCRFFDAGSVVISSEVDGIHLDPDAHERLGVAVAEFLEPLLQSSESH